MAGYQTIEALRPILHRGPVATPVVSRALVYRPREKRSPTLKQINRMVDLRTDGLSTEAIASQLGFHRSTVRRYTRHVPPPAGGWSDGSRPSRLTDKQLAKAARMHRAGFTWAEIAEDLGANKSTIRRALGFNKESNKAVSPLSKVVRAVRDVTGIAAADIRQSSETGAKVSARVARARHITFWIAHTQADVLQVEIAKRLGGFNVKTVSRGYVIADGVAKRLPIRDGMAFGRIANLMWAAEWPKASA